MANLALCLKLIACCPPGSPATYLPSTGLENDQYVRQIEGYLPTAEVAFIDEIFKANSAILNALLTLLNERLFDNGAARLEVPLLCLVGGPAHCALECATGAVLCCAVQCAVRWGGNEVQWVARVLPGRLLVRCLDCLRLT